jgi:hypothetical protein
MMKVVGCITFVKTKFTIKFHTNSKNEDSCNSGCFEQKITLQSQLSPISDVKLKRTNSQKQMIYGATRQ